MFRRTRTETCYRLWTSILGSLFDTVPWLEKQSSSSWLLERECTTNPFELSGCNFETLRRMGYFWRRVPPEVVEDAVVFLCLRVDRTGKSGFERGITGEVVLAIVLIRESENPRNATLLSECSHEWLFNRWLEVTDAGNGFMFGIGPRSRHIGVLCGMFPFIYVASNFYWEKMILWNLAIKTIWNIRFNCLKKKKFNRQNYVIWSSNFISKYKLIDFKKICLNE